MTMTSKLTPITVESLFPDGSYLATLKDGSSGVISKDDINYIAACKKPNSFLGKTLLAEETGEIKHGLPCYSCREYELGLIKQITSDFETRTRNTYLGTVVYKDWKQQKFILVEIAQGITGILSSNSFCSTPLDSFGYMNIQVGAKLPVAISDIRGNTINLNSIPAFGSFDENTQELSVGCEIEGLVIGEAPNAPGELVCMIKPNLHTRLKAGCCAPGDYCKLRVDHINREAKRIEAVLVEKLTTNTWCDPTWYILADTPAPWIDLAAFREAQAQQPRPQANGMNSLNVQPPAVTAAPPAAAPLPRPTTIQPQPMASKAAVPAPAAAAVTPKPVQAALPKPAQAAYTSPTSRPAQAAHTTPTTQPADEVVNWTATVGAAYRALDGCRSNHSQLPENRNSPPNPFGKSSAPCSTAYAVGLF